MAAVIAPSPRASTVHLRHLDGMRALAALFVLVHHCFLTVWPNSHRMPHGPMRYLFGCFLYRHFAVGVFIVISGFCLTLPVVRCGGELHGGALHFFRKRARRILPPYYASMAVSLLLIALLIGRPTGTHWDLALPVTTAGLFRHIFLVNDVYSDYSINHVFWSIAVEWHIYFLFPLILLAWRKFDAVSVTIAACVVGYLLYASLVRGPYIGATPQYLALFALGMLAAKIAVSTDYVWKRVADWRGWLAVSLCALAVVCVICSKIGVKGALNQFGFLDALIGIFAAALMIATTANSNLWATRWLSTTPLVACGTFAYSIYLMHAPLEQVLWQYLLHPLRLGEIGEFIGLVFLGGPIIVLLCYGFFLVFERPFLTKAKPKTSTT